MRLRRQSDLTTLESLQQLNNPPMLGKQQLHYQIENFIQKEQMIPFWNNKYQLLFSKDLVNELLQFEKMITNYQTTVSAWKGKKIERLPFQFLESIIKESQTLNQIKTIVHSSFKKIIYYMEKLKINVKTIKQRVCQIIQKLIVQLKINNMKYCQQIQNVFNQQSYLISNHSSTSENNLKVKYLQEDVKNIKEDVKNIKEDMKTINEKVDQLISENIQNNLRIKVLQEDVKVIKEDVNNIKEDVKNIKEDVKGQEALLKQVLEEMKFIKTRLFPN